MFRRFSIAVLVAATFVAATVTSSSAKDDPPQTGFEQSGGAEWTTHEQELEFLAEVDRLSDRVEIDVVGKTVQGRPMHLVQLGAPSPSSRAEALRQPTVLFIGSQHGNEPAGREASLKLLRDLAFTDEAPLVKLLGDATILFIPSANPDGREANDRENAKGVDINRDHLNLVSPEAQTMAGVVRDWKPDVVLDLHEYGPSIPGVYDDELLYLWPRNLNVDEKVYGLARTLSDDYLEPKAEEAGYRADEYGQYELADNDIHQSAGDQDEGIARNAMGLRHSVGILVESAVTQDPRNGPDEVLDEAAVQLRRVDSQVTVGMITLGFLADKGGVASKETAAAAKRAVAEGRSGTEPFFFGGADNDEPTEEEIADPPPCSYELDAAQYEKVAGTLKLLGIKSQKTSSGGATVSMAQPGQPLIPLLLDERGARHSVTASAQDC